MDHLFGRLSFVALLCFSLLCGVVPLDARADPVTSAQAQAQCEAANAPGNAYFDKYGQPHHWSCVDHPPTTGRGYYEAVLDGGASYGGDFYYDSTSPPNNPCSAAAPMNGAFSGNLSAGASMCSPQGGGSSLACNMTFTPDGPPFQNRAGTSWATHGTYKPSGDTCTSQGGNAPPPNAPPKSCGGESCYDAAADKYCATDSSGAQICVPGSGARSPTGSCASGGSTTVCAGTPSPPKPPAPPASPISDPPTETRGTDKYPQQANAATSASNPGIQGNFTTNVTVYGTGTSQPASGQGTGDDGPAPASTSGGTGTDDKKSDGTSASGGIDCNNPPSVQGSPALAMVAMQQWQGRCAMEKALNGTSSPGDITVPSGSSAWQGTVIAGDPIAASASKGNFDQSGMGFSSTCPMHDLLVPLWQGSALTIPFSKGCPVGEWIRAIVIAFSLLAAAKITVGSNG